MDDLLFRPALELAALVRDGEVTARELTEAALRRIEARNDEINAFTFVDAERALADADAIRAGDDRPFAGVPTAIKDLTSVQGWPLTFGSELAGDLRGPVDTFVVRRLREAGFVPLGITNMPEFGIQPTTEPRRYGPTRNPWDTSRTAGGSSGGAAAAVAAGMVPLAHGTDGGGSVRIPAACCGLVGIKPQRGRVSVGPLQGDTFLVQDAMLTRTVADTAAALDVLAGYELGDATWAPPPEAPFAELARRTPSRLRVAFTTRPPLEGATVHPIADRALREAAGLVAELGHEVEEIDPPWNVPGSQQLFVAEFGPLVASSMAAIGMVVGREPARELVEPLSWMVWEQANALTAPQYLVAHGQLTAMARQLIAEMAPYDVVMTPSLAQRPVELGTIAGHLPDPEASFRGAGLFTPFTPLLNCTGQPAVSVPFAHGEDGLPAGVQLIGRPADEGTILALAAQLEDAHPWADRRPPEP